MKNFKIRKGGFIKSSNNTTNMMYNVLYVLVFFIIFATYKNGIYPAINGYGNLYDVFKPLILTSFASITSLFTEYLYFFIIKKEKKSLYTLFSESYAIIPGVFLSLIIPINTPLWLLILGAFMASLSKMIMGGLGKNVLNPALVGSLFVTIIFSSFTGGYLNAYEMDAISSATPLSNFTAGGYVATYDNLVSSYGSLIDFFLGNIPGSIGETSALLCIISFVYLVYKKVIKWRIPVSYLITVVIISLGICIFKDVGIWFVLFNIFSGGLLFGAIFMATDPVTTPINHFGQIFGGIFLGIMTMIIRYLTPLPEGVMISILIFNILTIFINKLSIKLFDNKYIRICIIVLLVVLTLGCSYFISTKVSNKPLDDTYRILSKLENGNITTYEVSGRGYSGNNSLKLRIVFTDNQISDIEIIGSHETYTNMIYTNDYLNKLVSNQNNLDNLDTISGATYTSKYLKEIVSKTILDYSK